MSINHDNDLSNPYYTALKKDTNEYQRNVTKVLRQKGIEHNARPEEEKNAIRRKQNYILPLLSEDDLNYHAPNKSQKKINAALTNRDAIKEVYGADAYRAIDATYTASEGIRSIPIHHSTGNAALDKHQPVLELDFAGSGFAQTRKEHRGLHGNAVDEGKSDEVLEEALIRQYGSRVMTIGNKSTASNHIRVKTTVRGNMTKYRYTFPGPSADNKGLSDTGLYKIDNNSENALLITKEFLTPLIEEYRNSQGAVSFNMPIHIKLTGHSRGGIAASESLYKIKEWLGQQEGIDDFTGMIQFDLLQRDPVPGPDVLDERKNNIDLRQMMNVNATTIYTTVADADEFGVAFRPQVVRGQSRIIIGTMPHSAGLEGVDMSQMNDAQDGSAHSFGYYNPENHEFYRGSGIGELPHGVYITDEKRNLFRITQYSQLDKVINLVNPKDTWLANQAPRQIRLRNIVKNWMIDNPEKLVYPSSDSRKKCLSDAETNKAILMNFDDSWLKPVQDAIRANTVAQTDDEKARTQAALLDIVRSKVNEVTFEEVNKKKEKDLSLGTKNQKLNALCDLYCTLQTEENFRNNPQKYRDKWNEKAEKDNAAIEDKEFNQEGINKGADFVSSNELREKFQGYLKGLNAKRALKIPHSDSPEIKDLRAKTEELLRAIDNSKGRGTNDPKVRLCMVKVNAASITYQKHIRREKGVSENDTKYVYSGSDMGKARYDSAHDMEKYTGKLVKPELTKLLEVADKARRIEEQQSKMKPRARAQEAPQEPQANNPTL